MQMVNDKSHDFSHSLRTNLQAPTVPQCREVNGERCPGLAPLTSIPNPKDVLLSLPRALEKGRWVLTQGVRMKTSLWKNNLPTRRPQE